jgi:uncharacterized membrane protein
MAVPIAVAILGVLLLFFLPGFAVTRALFPEWRLRGDAKWLRIVETGTLSLVLSVGFTILLGFGLLNLPSGFAAGISDPVLEVGLASITAVGFLLAAVRGSFARTPPTGPALPEATGEEGTWEAVRSFDRLSSEIRRVRHALRVASTEVERRRLTDRLSELEAELRQRGEQREREIAG